MKKNFKNSLSYRQARHTVLSGVVLGLLVSCILVFQDLITVRDQIESKIKHSIEAVFQSASQAAYEIDSLRARGAVSGILKDKAIKEVRIIDDFGTVLAHNLESVESHKFEVLVNWLFGNKLQYTEPLTWGDEKKIVGEIVIVVDGQYMANDFINRSIRTIVGTFILVSILAFIFTFLFYRSIILPILRVVGLVSAVDTKNPGHETIDMPKNHEDNELGLLVSAINHLIEGYSDSLEVSRESEDKIRQSETRYRLLIEKSPLGIIIVDTRGNILNVNAKLLKILGSPSAGDTKGINVLTFTPLIESGISQNFVQCAELGKPGVFETAYTSTWGRQSFMRYHLQPITDGDDQIIAIQGMVEDISETRKLEEQLKQAQKMEAIGTLAGGISHDFNNILQAINGYTQILLFDRNEKDPDYKKLIAIRQSAERAAKLVRQLLLFSRKMETEFQPIDLNREVEQARKLLERTIPKMIEIQIKSTDDLDNINADPVQIEQVLLNLGSNASDSMPNGGLIAIRTENITVGDNHNENNLEIIPGRYVLLTFSDTGTGMDPRILAHIFEPFFTTKEIGKGTGLGLASVYGIIKSHGGYITCMSEIGQGTTFKIYFPALERITAETEPEKLADLPRGRAETVLVVDDDVSVREFARQALIRFGYQVEVAASGEDALKVYSVKSDRIELVILDIGMPGMGGHNCLRELLKINPSARIIIASGYSVDSQLKKTIEWGARGFIGKPYQLNDFIIKVRSVLDEAV